MKGSLASVLLGLLFGGGLALSGMTQPAKVIGFLDVTGRWDPTLAFVMAGALAVFSPLYAYIARRSGDDASFLKPVKGRVDAPLIVGAAIFGVGWGMAGYCPGPGITCVGTGTPHALTFFIALFAGMLLFQLYRRIATRAARKHSDASLTNAEPERG